MFDVIIIGGGLAGLCAAIQLHKSGKRVLLIEKKHYPFHRVCGEYVSNETQPYLQQLGLNLESLGAKSITEFQFTSPQGHSLLADLDLGGFGISRYKLDYALYQLALGYGVTCLCGVEVEQVVFQQNSFVVYTSQSSEGLEARYVIGAYGKRTKLDATLKRPFLAQRSPYVGIKYHIKTDFPQNRIALHNFKDGYCGISAIEDDKYCLCYLTTRENLRINSKIPDMERNILWKNPYLKEIFTTSEFLYNKPEVINEISFSPKSTIENHILMIGDTAGLITPLCGNGMAMAIHGAKIVSEILLENFENRTEVETLFAQQWKHHFATRLWVGRTVQKLFGNELLSEIALQTLRIFRPALSIIMKSTHGKTF
ncbi:NAD(P)/FAD-dependent oxidoreductase [Flectobacillus major]|uniref:NAD(P)/FAD-dependent oxidoreductase n=1 Tax=Flectobacillus major TaxID=103 RepID=UPI0003F5A80F|nr:NAD(P)/FAD-dependent oxidoreductase [Flectobacillus major]